VTLGFPLGPRPCNPFALVASPKLRLRQKTKEAVSNQQAKETQKIQSQENFVAFDIKQQIFFFF